MLCYIFASMQTTTPQKIILTIAVLANSFFIVLIFDESMDSTVFGLIVIVNIVLYALYRVWSQNKQN